MKKLFILTLMISTLLFSCSTTEEAVDIVAPEPGNVETVVAEDEKAPVVAEPIAEEPVVEVPPVEDEAETFEVVEESEEEIETMKEAFKATETPEKAEEDKVLVGKALVDQISEEENLSKAKEEEKLPPPVVEEEKVVPSVEETPVVEKVEKKVEPEVKPAAPVVEAKAPQIVEVPEKEESSVFDTAIDSRILSIVVEVISIMVLFALSSVIRNKYARPLSLGLSFLLAILFTAIPMLISFILFGWSNLHLIYLVIIFTVFIFSSHKGH